MKNSLIFLTGFITLGTLGWLSVPTSPNLTSKDNIQKIEKELLLHSKLDSIQNFRDSQIALYEKEIQKSSQIIKNEQKTLEKINMSSDSLLELVNSFDTVVNDTILIELPKRKSWFKRTIEKLKKHNNSSSDSTNM